VLPDVGVELWIFALDPEPGIFILLGVFLDVHIIEYVEPGNSQAKKKHVEQDSAYSLCMEEK
jgi:hypothetical protein